MALDDNPHQLKTFQERQEYFKRQIRGEPPSQSTAKHYEDEEPPEQNSTVVPSDISWQMQTGAKPHTKRSTLKDWGNPTIIITITSIIIVPLFLFLLQQTFSLKGQFGELKQKIISVEEKTENHESELEKISETINKLQRRVDKLYYEREKRNSSAD